MTKSDLKKIIKVIVTEIHSVQQERLSESKKGLSGFKKSTGKKDNTQMKSDDKSITSTDKPTEKKEGKKLPEKGKNNKSNTDTNHMVSTKSTPTLKETIIGMIREALSQQPVSEMARTAGSIGLKYKVEVEPGKWVIQGHPTIPDGTPTTPGKNTGLNYTPRPKNSTATPPAPTGEEGDDAGEEKADEKDTDGPDLPAENNMKINVTLNGKLIGVLNLLTPAGSIDPRPLLGKVRTFIYTNENLFDYQNIDQSVYDKFEEFADMAVDHKLRPGSTVKMVGDGSTLRVKSEPSAQTRPTAPDAGASNTGPR